MNRLPSLPLAMDVGHATIFRVPGLFGPLFGVQTGIYNSFRHSWCFLGTGLQQFCSSACSNAGVKKSLGLCPFPLPLSPVFLFTLKKCELCVEVNADILLSGIQQNPMLGEELGWKIPFSKLALQGSHSQWPVRRQEERQGSRVKGEDTVCASWASSSLCLQGRGKAVWVMACRNKKGQTHFP